MSLEISFISKLAMASFALKLLGIFMSFQVFRQISVYFEGSTADFAWIVAFGGVFVADVSTEG
jgi:hypothetical protein